MGTNDNRNKTDGQVARLPACQSCYAKKAKCDNARPKCTPCMKNGLDCFVVSIGGSEPLSRETIHRLEQNAQRLQKQYQDIEAQSNGNQQHPGSSEFLTSQAPAEIEHVDTQTNTRDEEDTNRDPSPVFTDGAGIRALAYQIVDSFMSLLFTDSGWREKNSNLLQDLSKASVIVETTVKPNSLPDPEEALIVFNNYLSHSHVQNPFLLRRDVKALYHSVFSSPGLTNEDETRRSKHDYFRTFMILAIGSVVLYRNNRHRHHPYGYFLSAMKNIDPDILSRGVESIQDLLLVSRFAIYHHIGTSIWELLQLCMRICVESGLQKPPANKNAGRKRVGLLQEQLQRRVFWQCYMIDRYSSITLDRPPALAEGDIQIGFPADVDDEDIDAAEASGSFPDLESFCNAISQNAPAEPTEMSVFLYCVRLRQITSKIYTSFQQSQIHLLRSKGAIDEFSALEMVETISSNLDELLLELDKWRHSAPTFQNPKSLYQMQDWYDLLLVREKLLAVRKAIDLVPKHNQIPPHELLSTCLQYATQGIMKFYDMFSHGKVTYTRSYFQFIFMSGLSVMLCISVMIDAHDLERIAMPLNAVEHAELVLRRMTEDLPDAVPYVAVFEALRANVLAKPRRLLEYAPLMFTNDLPGQQHMTLMTERTSELHPYLHTYIARGPDGEESVPQRISNPLHSSSSLPAHHQLPALYDTADNLNADHPIPTIENSLAWNIFSNNSFWNMEAGLSQYAYGDATAPLFPAFMDDFLNN